MRETARIVAALCAAVGGAGEAFAQLADVEQALARIAPQAAPLVFDRGDFQLPPGGHLQGIQMRSDAALKRHLVFATHDSLSVAYLVIVEFPADLAGPGRVVGTHTFPGDGQSPPLRHAGGIQLLDDVLVVGLEDNQHKTRSEVQFWNVGDPAKLARLDHLTIRRQGEPKDMTAGAVGIARRKTDHLVAVANWDSRAIDFYASNGKPLDDPDCRFALLVRWQDARADKADWRPDARFAAYQAVNLVGDAAGKLFLLGFATDPRGQNVVELFALDRSRPPEKMLRKVAAKTLRLPEGNQFRYAGGMAPLSDGPALLSSPRTTSGETTLGIAR